MKVSGHENKGGGKLVIVIKLYSNKTSCKRTKDMQIVILLNKNKWHAIKIVFILSMVTIQG